MGKFIDLTGQIFNRLKVLSLSHKKKYDCGTVASYWKCLCNCGKTVIVGGNSLKSKNTQSCGCLHLEHVHRNRFRFIDLTNKTLGRLRVVKLSHKNKWGTSCWKCRCNCGKEVIVDSNNLRRGLSQSCGCFNADINRMLVQQPKRICLARVRNQERYMRMRGELYNVTSPL